MSTREENLSVLRKAAKVVEPGQKFVVDDFRPEDARGVAELYYAVYGENFPVDYVYSPEEIAAAMQRRETHLVVGRTTAGEIVGLYALFRNPPGRYIMEAGSWIVLPSYRSTTLAMRMAHRIHTAPPEDIELNVTFGQMVCDHVITQKMGVKYDTYVSALEIEAMPPRPDDGQGRGSERISLLDGFMIHRDTPHAVYLPDRYAETLRDLHARRELEREYLVDTGPAESTASSIQTVDNASLVKMTIDEPGRDVGKQLAAMMDDYPDRHVYQLVLPLWRPGVSYAVEQAREHGFFLGGLLILWDDKDALLMQRVATPTDYSKIKLHTEEAKRLLEIIIADRDSLPHGN